MGDVIPFRRFRPRIVAGTDYEAPPLTASDDDFRRWVEAMFNEVLDSDYDLLPSDCNPIGD